MENKRATPDIRCIDCAALNAYERCNQGVWEVYCPDCGAVFGFDNLPKECRECKWKLRGLDELCQGMCASCWVASWSAEKKAAIGNLIGMAFKKPDATDTEKDTAIDEAFKHL
jgi:hypothetical protein